MTPLSSVEIPIEIVSREEMALLEAALLSARSLFFSPKSQSQTHLTKSITLLSKRTFCSEPDIEDSGRFSSTQKIRSGGSLFHRFRNKRAFSATDLTASEWCEKQKERYLESGTREINKAMKTGIERHAKLEEEVVTRVKVDFNSEEDKWALKLLNFITGINQLYFEGLIRELFLFSCCSAASRIR